MSGGIRHPFGGALYTCTPEGNIRVEDGTKWGLFQRDGQWIEGELREADPQHPLHDPVLAAKEVTAFGATFPLMTAAVLRRVPGAPGRVLALFYFANSFGAALARKQPGNLAVAKFTHSGSQIVGGKNPVWNRLGHERMGWLLSLFNPPTP